MLRDEDLRLCVDVVEGPADALGPRVFVGNPVEVAAFPRPALDGVPPQVCVVTKEGDTLRVRPMPGTHVRLGDGEDWRSQNVLDTEVTIERGQHLYLGPIERGIGLRILGFESSASEDSSPTIRTVDWTGGVGAFLLAAFVLLLWAWVMMA